MVVAGGPVGAAAPTMTAYSMPTGGGASFAITSGTDSALWFTEFGADKIGRITTAGTITEFRGATRGAVPSALAAGPDGSVWYTEDVVNKVVRVTTP